MKIVEAQINEKTFKNMFGGEFRAKRKIGETDFYTVWIADDVNAGIPVIVLTHKNIPKLTVPLTWGELEELPGILKKAIRTELSGVSSTIHEDKDWSGFQLEFNYDGDGLSDYRASCFVKARDEREALKKAKDGINKAINYGKLDWIRNPYKFEVVDTLPSFKEYKKTHPLSNILVIDDKGVGRVNEHYTFED